MNKNRINPPGPLAQAAFARLAEVAMLAVAGVPAAQMRGRRRGIRNVAAARQTAMYLSHVVFGLSFTRVGICFGRDRTTVSHACALVEEWREDPRLELGLGAMEAGLAALTRSLMPAARPERLS